MSLKKTLVITSLIISGFVSSAFIDNYFEVSKNLDIFATLYKEINTYYVDDIEPAKMMRTGIDAMLETLDPYTTFISEAEIEDYRFQTTGKYGGIGALIRKSRKQVIIAEPYEGYPADRAGLKAGDVLVEIGGKEVKDKNTDDISKILKGQPGTSVVVKYKRPSSDSIFTTTLQREEIKIDAVPYYAMISENTGYIKLTNFTEKAGKSVRDAMVELKKDPKLQQVILDLRGNPGGLLSEAVNVSNVFIEKGVEVVSTKGKIKDWDKTYKTLNTAVDTEIPLAVLTNRGSASASEIVSGVMQDLDRGVIIGQRTFGKGLVQTTRPISFNTQLKVTTAKYYIPSKRCIQAIDYSHRNEDGSVGKVPDSLKNEFRTRSGRVVFDGGGIEPDISVENDKLTKVSISLLRNELIFDFATQFALKNDSLSNIRDFHVDDAIYDEFISFLEDKTYDYTTKSEESLKELIENSKNEKYYTAIEESLDNLESKIKHDKNKDLIKYKEEIRGLLKEEIVSRYFYQKGRITASLENDPDVQAAFDVFKDQNEYFAILDNKSKGKVSKDE